MTSLHELRAIEEQRIAEEREAIVRARAAEVAATQAAEQARIEAAAARERAEREERIRIEEARGTVEREARMRIEAAEAAERARLTSQLEQERLVQEMELRRAEVAKQRPTWMVAVTGIALALGAGLAWFALDRMHQADAAEEAKARADEQVRQAKTDAATAVARVDAMQRDLDELDGKVAQAEHALDVATTEAQRQQAKALLDAANRKAQLAHEAWLKAKQAQDHVDRVRPITIDSCGANNVLCSKH